jgi:hypothetical protein
MGESGSRFFRHIQELAGFGKIQYCGMDSATMGGDVFEEICMRGSEGKVKGKAMQQAAGNGFG